MGEVEKPSQKDGEELPPAEAAPSSSRKLRPPRPISGTLNAVVPNKPPSVRKVSGTRGSNPSLVKRSSTPELSEPGSRAPLSSSDLSEASPSDVAMLASREQEAVAAPPPSDPTTFTGSERSLVIDLPGTRVAPPPNDRPTMPAVEPLAADAARSSERSGSTSPVDSTSAMTASVEPGGLFVSALATGVTPQDETFIVRRKRKTLPLIAALGALAVGATGAFLALDDHAVLSGQAATQAVVKPTIAATPPVVSAPPVVAPLVVAPAQPAVEPPPPPPAQAAAPAPAAPARPDLPEGKGSLKTDDAKAGRRIFVDGRVVGQTPESVVVACGLHAVKIGSSGRTSQIEIPCQGEIALGDW